MLVRSLGPARTHSSDMHDRSPLCCTHPAHLSMVPSLSNRTTAHTVMRTPSPTWSSNRWYTHLAPYGRSPSTDWKTSTGASPVRHTWYTWLCTVQCTTYSTRWAHVDPVLQLDTRLALSHGATCQGRAPNTKALPGTSVQHQSCVGSTHCKHGAQHSPCAGSRMTGRCTFSASSLSMPNSEGCAPPTPENVPSYSACGHREMGVGNRRQLGAGRRLAPLRVPCTRECAIRYRYIW